MVWFPERLYAHREAYADDRDGDGRTEHPNENRGKLRGIREQEITAFDGPAYHVIITLFGLVDHCKWQQ